MGFGKVWKGMEIENAFFQNLERFGKRGFQSPFGKDLRFYLEEF